MSAGRRGAIAMLAAGLAVLGFGVADLAPGSGRGAGLIGAGIGLLAAAAMMWRAPAWLRDAAPPALVRRYYRDFLPPMLAYVAVMPTWRPLLDAVGPTWLRVVVALLPALLVVLAIRAVARFMRDADEMQRRIELESVAIAAGGVAAVYMAGGFLQSAGLIAIPASVAMLWVFPMLCVGYGFIKIAIASRYA
ncbi:hypothetical protein [[Pseudomonas] boreopolis]|uniref:Uncharacterized protein n=1 Tax=Xanthomonas boreopolis TaxID=86183 RepID=A0A919FBT5_9XANT|nr:hypothetical protein GCM10009090_35820 [[Pseudomonas] boreopolis]